MCNILQNNATLCNLSKNINADHYTTVCYTIETSRFIIPIERDAIAVSNGTHI